MVPDRRLSIGLLSLGLMVGVGVGRAIASQFPEGVIASDPPQPTAFHRISQSAPSTSPTLPKSKYPRITAATVSQTGLTVPSLWWVQEQFGNKLLEDWAADLVPDDQPGQVDLIVNRQLWTLLDYLDRYAFVTKFGTAARDSGYNLRVVYRTDGQNTPLAEYTCDFSSANIRALRQAQVASLPSTRGSTTPQTSNSVPCSIELDSTGKAGFRGERSNPFSR